MLRGRTLKNLAATQEKQYSFSPNLLEYIWIRISSDKTKINKNATDFTDLKKLGLPLNLWV
jgi:hypothetical protein